MRLQHVRDKEKEAHCTAQGGVKPKRTQRMSFFLLRLGWRAAVSYNYKRKRRSKTVQIYTRGTNET